MNLRRRNSESAEVSTESLNDISDDWNRVALSDKLYDFMSFDEMDLSSFIAMSIYTPFINKGHKNNKGIDDSFHEVHRCFPIAGGIGHQIDE